MCVPNALEFRSGGSYTCLKPSGQMPRRSLRDRPSTRHPAMNCKPQFRKPRALCLDQRALRTCAYRVGWRLSRNATRENSRHRRTCARDCVKAIVLRYVRDIAEVEKLDQLPRLLQVFADHSGQLTKFTQIGGQLGIDDKTTRKYIGILEQLFLVYRVSPWFRNHKRLIKTPSSTS
jgi:hypothetical protein